MRELSLHILDALENSIEAGATLVELIIEEDVTADWLSITIGDNGRGMSEAQLARVADPFYTTRSTRHVGLGVPLLKAAAERCDGSLNVTSQVGVGTRLQATFRHSHIDRAPLGDMTSTLLAFILSGQGHLRYVHRVGESAFELDTAEIQAQLGDVPLTHPEMRKWLREFIAEGEGALG
jgi:hypothetical protein